MDRVATSRYRVQGVTMNPASVVDDNKTLVAESFDRWRVGTGSPFELLAPDAQWTIVGSSPLSKTYGSRRQFLDEVITPFNSRLKTHLIPKVRRIYGDGDTVIILFDAHAEAKDDRPYVNTYTWYFTMRDGKAVNVIAFFDTRDFDELFERVKL
jgi:ketosteroid isomerase-like protein